MLFEIQRMVASLLSLVPFMSPLKAEAEASSLKEEKDETADASDYAKLQVADSDPVPRTPQVVTQQQDTNALLRSAAEKKDYDRVMQCWQVLKASDDLAVAQFCEVVAAMKHCGKSSTFVAEQVQSLFTEHPGQKDMTFINDLLEFLSQYSECYLADLVANMLPSINLAKDSRSFEILFTMHATRGSSVKVQRLLSEMKAAHVESTPRTTVAMLKFALQTNDV